MPMNGTMVRVASFTCTTGSRMAIVDGPEFRVAQLHRYEVGDEMWYEAEGRTGGRSVALEFWEDEDGEPGFAFCDTMGLGLDDLGLDEEALIGFDEGSHPTGSFTWRGRTWRFLDSGETTFFEGNGRREERFYAWEFAAIVGGFEDVMGDDPGEERLWIEKWEDEPFTAGTSLHLPPGAVEAR